MYKLYYSVGACSKAPHIALHEIGAEHQAIRVQLHSPSGPDQALLAVNPRHCVPVLDDNGLIIREGAAILIYLLDKHESALLPQTGPERARALEWLAWNNASLHPAYGQAFTVKKFYADEAVQKAVADSAKARIQKMWDDANKHLANNKYLAGDHLTIADILMTVIAQWAVPAFDAQPTKGANVERVIKDVMARPSWKQATDMEESAAKIAA